MRVKAVPQTESKTLVGKGGVSRKGGPGLGSGARALSFLCRGLPFTRPHAYWQSKSLNGFPTSPPRLWPPSLRTITSWARQSTDIVLNHHCHLATPLTFLGHLLCARCMPPIMCLANNSRWEECDNLFPGQLAVSVGERLEPKSLALEPRSTTTVLCCRSQEAFGEVKTPVHTWGLTTDTPDCRPGDYLYLASQA